MSFFIYNYFNDSLSLWITRIVVGPALGVLITFSRFFKGFLEFVTILFLFYALAFLPPCKWDLCSPTRNRTCTPYTGRWSVNHWTTREVPYVHMFYEDIQRTYHFLISSPKPWPVILTSMSKYHAPSALKSSFGEKHFSFCDISIPFFLMTYFWVFSLVNGHK